MLWMKLFTVMLQNLPYFGNKKITQIVIDFRFFIFFASLDF